MRQVNKLIGLFCVVVLLLCVLCACQSSDSGTALGQNRGDTTDFVGSVPNVTVEMRDDLYDVRRLAFPDGYTPVDSRQRMRWMSVYGDQIVC